MAIPATRPAPGRRGWRAPRPGSGSRRARSRGSARRTGSQRGGRTGGLSARSARGLALEHELGAGAALDDLAGHDALLDAGERGDLVHDVEHDLLDDRAQAAGAGVAAGGLLGDRGQRVGPEVELDALELEQPMVLLGERVLGLPQHLGQRLDVERVARDDHRQPAHELGDHAELDQILGAGLAAQRVLVVLGGRYLRAEPQAALTGAPADDVLEAIERPAADEQDVRGVDLDQLLLRAVARAVGRDRRGLALEDLEQRLLDALTGHVARRRRRAALARDLVDLVDADDAARGLLDVAAGGAEQRLDHALDVLADVARLGERRGVRDGERYVELLGQGLGQQRLARAGRPDQQDVAFLELHFGLLPAQADPLVVVVDRNRERPFGVLLSDHVAIELLHDRAWWRGLGPFGCLFLGQDVVAESHALIADEHAGAADELPHFAPLLSAEGAVELFHPAPILTCFGVQAIDRSTLLVRWDREVHLRCLLTGSSGKEITSTVRVIVICADPDRAERPDRPDRPDESGTVAGLLGELGCRVTLGRFDLGGLDFDAIAEQPPAVVIVDAGDDVGRAHQSIKRMRDEGPLVEVPILIAITVARLPSLDFSIGFDDFVLMPIVPAELYARLRQLDWRTATFGSDEILKIDDLVIDIAGYEARLAGRRIELTHQEFELLRFLGQHRGRVFTREALLERAWGYRYAGGTRTVDIHVRRVRSKLGEAGAIIETVRNVGYKMRG